MKIKQYILVEKQTIKKNFFSFILHNDKAKNFFTPGQFVNISIENFTLRRPFSICEINKNGLRIVFKISGKGTKKMSTWQIGQKVDVMGPLGNGFLKVSEKNRLLLVGGGVGMAPLLGLAKQANFVVTLAGFDNKEKTILVEDFEKYGNLIVCTRKGDFGNKGLVTETIEKFKINRIAACGPEKKKKKIATIAKKEQIFCEISLEERMGCGFGACFGCLHIFNFDGKEKAFHICKDGPVFKI